MCVVCMYLDHIYSGSLDNLKILDLKGNYFWKINFEFWGSKSKNIKKSKYLFCRTFNFIPFDVFWLRLTSKLKILAALKHLPLFEPKLRNITSLKRHSLTNLCTDLSKNLLADDKSMPGKALKVSRRYLTPFLSYRESPAGGGGGIRPPPAGCVLHV